MNENNIDHSHNFLESKIFGIMQYYLSMIRLIWTHFPLFSSISNKHPHKNEEAPEVLK